MPKGPPIMSDLSFYNSRDGWLRSTHLSEFLTTSIDRDWVHRIDTSLLSRYRSDAQNAATSPENQIK